MSVLPAFLRAARTRKAEEEVIVESVPPLIDGEVPPAPSVIAVHKIDLCPPRHYPERLDFLYEAEVDREMEREAHHLRSGRP
jgi:hypothetical protein